MSSKKMHRGTVLGQQLAELRRSSAAGIHQKRRSDRAGARRRAIEFGSI